MLILAFPRTAKRSLDSIPAEAGSRPPRFGGEPRVQGLLDCRGMVVVASFVRLLHCVSPLSGDHFTIRVEHGDEREANPLQAGLVFFEKLLGVWRFVLREHQNVV